MAYNIEAFFQEILPKEQFFSLATGLIILMALTFLDVPAVGRIS